MPLSRDTGDVVRRVARYVYDLPVGEQGQSVSVIQQVVRTDAAAVEDGAQPPARCYGDQLCHVRIHHCLYHAGKAAIPPVCVDVGSQGMPKRLRRVRAPPA
jgi:hypothetical protein